MVASIVLAMTLASAPQGTERVSDVAVHGNTLTPDAEIIRLAGVEIGMPVDDRTAEEAAARLRAANRFERVDVLKRFASIADPTRIMLVIVVDEGPVKIVPAANGAPAAVVKSRGSRLMFLPVLDYEDGYGLSYGARFTVPDAFGRRTRLSFPATWGGDKRVAIEAEKTLPSARPTVVTRVRAGAAASRRTHPYFEADDDRRGVWVRGERDVTRWLRGGATASWDQVSFLGARDRLSRAGADVVIDTRLDPLLPRNAVYVRAGWDHLAFGGTERANRTELEGRGYIGLFGQSVLVVRALRQASDRPLPAYLMPTLGGMATLRGFGAGTAVGDTLVSTTAELRQPLTSPLSVGKFGVTAFVDAATAYANGTRFRDQTFRRGVGGGIWFSVAVVRLNAVVAHGLGGSTRVHVGTTVTF